MCCAVSQARTDHAQKQRSPGAIRGFLLLFSETVQEAQGELCPLNPNSVVGAWTFVPGVGEKFGGRAVADLVTQAQLTTHIQANGQNTDRDRAPSDEPQG